MKLKITLEVLSIKKKTTAVGFKDLKVGDVFQLMLELESNSQFKRSAEYFDMSINGGVEFHTSHSINTVHKYLHCFELKEV